MALKSFNVVGLFAKAMFPLIAPYLIKDRGHRLISSTSRHRDCSSRMKNVEGLGQARFRKDLALDDCLVGLRATLHVVRLDRQESLQR